MFTAPWPATGKKKAAGRRDEVTYYEYRADRARRTIRGIDQQIARAENAVAGKAAVKRNRFVKLTGGTRTINRDLEAKARAPAGFKAYITKIDNPDSSRLDACRYGHIMAPWHEQRRRRTSSTRSPSRSAGRSWCCCGRVSGR